MQSFPAANNLQIEADAYQWRLSAEHLPGVALVEADSRGLRYLPAFARARRLPEGGLRPEQVAAIIVGWEGDYWQLGLVFDGELESQRGRWCGVARWHDPAASAGQQTAYTAGRLLADLINRPFEFYPRRHAEPTPPTVEPTAESIEQQAIPDAPRARLATTPETALPIHVGEWTLAESRVGLAWERSRDWRRSLTIQIVFFGGLALVILLLAAGGLRSSFAPVQPEWLPLAGFVVALAMLIRAAYCALLLLRRSSLEFDERNRLIRVIRQPVGVLRQIPFEKIEYLLISDALSQRKPVRRLTESGGTEELIGGETWIHLRRQQGDFLEVAYIPIMDGRAAFDPDQPSGERQALDPERVNTPAHQAAYTLAQMMNIPAYHEMRWTLRDKNGKGKAKPAPPEPQATETPIEAESPQPEQDRVM